MTDEFTTPSASTLNPKSSPHDDMQIIDQAIRRMMELNDGQKSRWLGMVQGMLDRAATGKGTFSPSLHRPYQNGAGIPEAADAKSNEDLDWPTVAEFLAESELQEQLEEIGFNKDAQERAAALFFQAVEDRSKNDPLRQRLAELLNDPLINAEDLDLVEILANKIQELQGDLAYIENENQELMQNISKLHEETSKPPVIRSPRRSTINECLLEPDLDAEGTYYNQNQYTGRMREYLKAMGEDLDD